MVLQTRRVRVRLRGEMLDKVSVVPFFCSLFSAFLLKRNGKFAL
jgi:hypothetical protein